MLPLLHTLTTSCPDGLWGNLRLKNWGPLEPNSNGSQEDRWGVDSILPLQTSLAGPSARAYAFAYFGVVAYWSDEEKCWCKDNVRPPLHVSVCC